MTARVLRTTTLGFALALLASHTAASQDKDVLRKSLVGKTPPELVAADADWLAGPPVALARLKGKVVWLQFNF